MSVWHKMNPAQSAAELATRFDPQANQESIPPEQVWDLLVPAQQQVLFRTLVLVCHGLLPPPNNGAGQSEVNHDRA